MRRAGTVRVGSQAENERAGELACRKSRPGTHLSSERNFVDFPTSFPIAVSTADRRFSRVAGKGQVIIRLGIIRAKRTKVGDTRADGVNGNVVKSYRADARPEPRASRGDVRRTSSRAVGSP